VIHLTKQEMWVLFMVVMLLFTGFLVKAYRTAHPAAMVNQSGKP